MITLTSRRISKSLTWACSEKKFEAAQKADSFCMLCTASMDNWPSALHAKFLPSAAAAFSQAAPCMDQPNRRRAPLPKPRNIVTLDSKGPDTEQQALLTESHHIHCKASSSARYFDTVFLQAFQTRQLDLCGSQGLQESGTQHDY